MLTTLMIICLVRGLVDAFVCNEPEVYTKTKVGIVVSGKKAVLCYNALNSMYEDIVRSGIKIDPDAEKFFFGRLVFNDENLNESNIEQNTEPLGKNEQSIITWNILMCDAKVLWEV